jgi:hypothetical protein
MNRLRGPWEQRLDRIATDISNNFAEFFASKSIINLVCRSGFVQFFE